MDIINLQHVTKTFPQGAYDINVLKGINLNIEKGEMVAVIGPSGSGKTTLLNILGFMDDPTLGKYYLEGVDTTNYNERQYSKLRAHKISFIFQDYNLLDDYTVYENVEIPLLHQKMKSKTKKDLIYKTLEKLGIEDKIGVRASKLSGGERQRVAIARALVTGCEVILADEPTGALDQKKGREILSILKQLNEEGKTIILITHDLSIASQCKRIINIMDGEISEITESEMKSNEKV